MGAAQMQDEQRSGTGQLRAEWQAAPHHGGGGRSLHPRGIGDLVAERLRSRVTQARRAPVSVRHSYRQAEVGLRPDEWIRAEQPIRDHGCARLRQQQR